MNTNYIDTVIRRSRLIMPANNPKFIEKAYLRNADAIVLDLEDSVPESEKIPTRRLIKNNISEAAKGGSDVFVRVNNTKELLKGDIEAAVWSGLTGIYLPKVENKEQVYMVDDLLTDLEEKRSIQFGTIKISVLIESIRGYLNILEIAESSKRIDTLTLGAEDFAVETGIEISGNTYESMLIPRMQVLFAAKANGVIPMGLMGSLTKFNDLDGLTRDARLAYQHGFLGASCVHPKNVDILNQCFSPSKEEIEFSTRVIETFEQAVSEGKAATKLDGKMIDIPHYEKAKKILFRQKRIEDFEYRKKQARKQFLA